MTRNDIRDELVHLRDEAAILMETYLARPVLRGMSHLLACAVAFIAAALLVVQAGATIQVAASAIYGAGLTASLGVSALYHRVKWRPRAYRWIRALDHSMIFVLIASSYTPIILLALDDSWRIAALVVVWGISIAGVVLRLSVRQLPRPVMVGLCVGLGWGALSLLPALGAMSITALTLVIASGVIYTMGGFVYLLRRPDPLPRIFGFHEVFHAFVVIAATLHFVAVWPLVTA